MSSSHLQSPRSWHTAFRTYTHPAVVTLFFLGFSAGLPLLLIFGTLSLWLTRAGIEMSTITYFSWAALGYSFKFVWAPLIDRLPLPVLDKRLGRRRSWLLLTQLMIACAIVGMAMSEPASHHLQYLAYAAVFLGFSAASQDIVIDAYRIEIAAKEYQAAMSAMYQAGYRIAMLVASAGAFYMVAYFSEGQHYVYNAWQTTYLIMAACMSVGIITTLLMPEPEKNLEHRSDEDAFNTTSDYLRFCLLFILTTLGFILCFSYLDPGSWMHKTFVETLGFNDLLTRFVAQTLRIMNAIFWAIVVARLAGRLHLVRQGMVEITYINPVMDFIRRYRSTFVIILLLIGFYRISDIVLGAVALIFYDKLGFSEIEIANIGKTFGLFMIIAGGFLGGLLSARYGVLKILLLGSILAAATNILFMLFAQMGNNTLMFVFVIMADNLSGGLAGSAFIAYLSSLTNIRFTAMQYALFTSIMTLLPKLISGYSGSIVSNIGFEYFFLFTAVLGVPVVFLILYLIKTEAEQSA